MDKIEAFVNRYSVNRQGTDSVKWDHLALNFKGQDLLPMWVADLDFKVPEGIQEAMITRIEHGVFGYSVVPDSYFDAFFSWQLERYNVKLKKSWIRFSPGVVSSFFWMINAYTEVADSVLLLSPVYYPFYDSIKDTGRRLVKSDLVNEKGSYTIDFADIEEKIKQENVKLYLHCSPHNPVGRVWTEAELTQLFDLCLAYDVMIVSDEIHQDLIRPDLKYVGAFSLDKKYFSHLVVLNAPSKTFNLASLLNSHIIIPDKARRQVYDDYAATFQKSTSSLLGTIATEAAYRTGSEWLAGLIQVIEHNYQILATTFARELPKVMLSPKEGTYLAWVDLSAYLAADELVDFMENKCGLAVDYGEWFGTGCEGFIRINLGTEPKNIQFAVDKIVSEIAKG